VSPTSHRLLFWSPRVLCIALAAFLTTFAADVFAEPHPFRVMVAALLVHLIPSALVLLVLAIAWRHPWLGGIACTALGVMHLTVKWGDLPLPDLLIVAGPLFVIAILFFANSWLLPGRRSPDPDAGAGAA
jgi:hypothetical protein